MATRPVQGLICPILTPFTQEGAVDHPALAAHARRLVAAGVETLFVLGTTGEFHGLTLAERAAVMRTVLDHAGAVPVVAGISGESTRASLAILAAIQDPRLAGVVASTPYFMDYRQDELLAYFRSLAQAYGGPLILYNYPSRYRHRIDLETVEQLVAEGTAWAMKDTDTDLAYTGALVQLRARQPRFAVFASHCEHLGAYARLGIQGTVQATSNLLPEIFTALWPRVRAGGSAALDADVAHLWAFHRAMAAVGTYLVALKAGCAARGWCRPDTAPPTRPADAAGIEAMRRLLREAYPALEPGTSGSARAHAP